MRSRVLGLFALVSALTPALAVASDPFPVPRTLFAGQPSFKLDGGALVLTLDRAPIDQLVTWLPQHLPSLLVARNGAQQRLKTRNEAHVTILTPPEMQRARQPSQVRTLAAQLATQLALAPADVAPFCLGEGVSKVNPDLKTFFVVVHAPKLAQLRTQLAQLAGMTLSGPFLAHETVGFTDHDLFPESPDAVSKDDTTCKSSPQFTP